MPERKYVWDELKALTNLRKHDVGFEEAKQALGDPFAVVAFDAEHSVDEDRFILLGLSGRLLTLAVVYAEINEHTTRIISARRASKAEQRIYEENLRRQG